MNIAIFTNNYLPNPYGVSISIETFRREFERLGHQVYIFAPRWPGYKDTNSNVFRYPALDINIKFRFPLAIPHSRKTDAVISSLDLDVIHSQHPNLLGTAAMKWARRKKIPLIFTWHTLYDHYTNFVPFIPARISAGYMIRKAVKYANRSDAVVVPTDSIIPILKNWGVKKEMTSVATGVVEEEFSGADRNIIRRKYNIGEEKILLLLVSRLTEEKNIEFIFRSLKNILRDENSVKFLISGGGYLAGKLKEFCQRENIARKVIFTEVVPREELKYYYAAGDIFVWASQSETQGMILTEAMYSGLPIVAVSATGTNSLVKDNINGFLVAENEKEFSEAVQKLVADASLRQKFSENSKRIAQENFTSDVCAGKMLKVYENCLRNRG